MTHPHPLLFSDFHPRLLGLTGSYDAIKAACKAYRVYFSTPPNTKPGDDYLVDHSIFFYLMDPQGEFVDAYGKSMPGEEVRERIVDAIKAWKPRPQPAQSQSQGQGQS